MASSSSAVGTTTSPPAPEIQIPPVRVYSVEYPGYVQPTSVSEAVRTLGGQPTLERAFRKSSKPDAFLELRYRPDNPFAHPIAGEVVQTNSILLKVVKRRRKRVEGASADGQDTGLVGEYTVEPVGLIPGTARFRGELTGQVWFLRRGYTLRSCSGLADYQYNPDPEDPVSKLRMGMEVLDGQCRRSDPLASVGPHFLQSTRSANSPSRRRRRTTRHLETLTPWQSIRSCLGNLRPLR
jgi:general transcription factor 3C polypeptide 5 (transcription factor C subunit 1)